MMRRMSLVGDALGHAVCPERRWAICSAA
ncbi:hypothetical protein [Kingella potus]|nr:hypothetical protein [Kingella potus]